MSTDEKPLNPSFIQNDPELKKKLHDTPLGEKFRPYEMFIMNPIPAVIDQCGYPTPNAKRIYGRLCRYQGAVGEAFPLHATIGKELHISRHNVIDALKDLEELGWILSKPTGGAKHYYFLKNRVLSTAEKIQDGSNDWEPCCKEHTGCTVHDLYNNRLKTKKDEKGDVQNLNNGCSESEQRMFSFCTSDVQKVHIGCSESEHIRDSSKENQEKESEKRIIEEGHIAPVETGEGVGVSEGSTSDEQVNPKDLTPDKKVSENRNPFVARDQRPISLKLINQGAAEIEELYKGAYEERVGVPMVSDKERGVLRSLVKEILIGGRDLSILRDIVLHDVADNAKANRTLGAIANIPRYQTWTSTVARDLTSLISRLMRS